MNGLKVKMRHRAASSLNYLKLLSFNAVTWKHGLNGHFSWGSFGTFNGLGCLSLNFMAGHTICISPHRYHGENQTIKWLAQFSLSLLSGIADQ